MRYTCHSLALIALVLSSTAAGAQELRNDGFQSGQAAGFQEGFIAGEIGAVTLETPTATLHRLDAITFLFGPAPLTQTVTVRIWEEAPAGGLGFAPGQQIFSGDYSVQGSADSFTVVDLQGEEIFVSGAFRVGIEFQHSGNPAIARDADGTIDVARNFILADGFGWVPSNLFALTGDWVIRARVRNTAQEVDAGVEVDAGGPVDAGTPTDGGAPIDGGPGPVDAGAPELDAGAPTDGGAPVDGGAPADAGPAPADAGPAPEDAGGPAVDAGQPPADAGQSVDDAGAGEPEGEPGVEPDDEPEGEPESEPEDAPCSLNSDCLNGSYCGDDGFCTQDCRIDTDCSDGNVCDSLGRCVEEAEVEIPANCRCVGEPERGAPIAAALVFIGLLGLGGRRRRRG